MADLRRHVTRVYFDRLNTASTSSTDGMGAFAGRSLVKELDQGQD
jgi:hypothetical protein